MSAVVIVCPTCRTPLSDSSLIVCPNCSRSLSNAPTRVLRDLNTTTDFGVPAPDDASDHLIGTQLGNYAIEQFMGQGGMARVYRAKHLTLERPCAIKVLKHDFVDRSAGAVAAFLAEARAAAALVHPHVVTIHSIGNERGFHFIEMEFIDGNSLASLLDAHQSFNSASATKFMVEICSALSLAHQFGMVHRDIKPANVLVTRDRVAKLADFGLAKHVQEPHGDDGKFLTGTPNYMAPELFEGRPADKRSDVYAMGITFFVLLTGRLPFVGESLADVMQGHLFQPLPDMDQLGDVIPQNAARLIRRCLSKQPEDRFCDAEALLHELRAVYGSLRSLESLLQESLRREPVTLHGSGNNFEAIVQLSGGRRQKVTIEIRDSVAVSEQVVRISSICGPADEKHFLRALRLNPDFPYGALGVEFINSIPHFVMTNVYPRSTCDPEEIRHSVLGIAQHADDAERWLSDSDVH